MPDYHRRADGAARRGAIPSSSASIRCSCATSSGAETMLRDGGMTVLNQVLVGSLSMLDFLILLVVTPVVAFYLLLDWDRMVRRSTRSCRASTRRPSAGSPGTSTWCWRGSCAGSSRSASILGAFYALGADGDRPAVRLPRRADRRAHLVHPLRRLDGRAAALGRHRALPVLGRQVLDAGDRGHLLLRPVRRGQHPVAEPDRQVGGAASGLAASSPSRSSARSSASPGCSSRCRWRRRSG